MQAADTGEGAAALAIITRFMIHLRVNGLLSKATTLNLLTDADEALTSQERDSAARLVSQFATKIHAETRDDHLADEATLL